MDVDLSETPWGSLLSSPVESLYECEDAEQTFSEGEGENFFDPDHHDVSDGRMLKAT